MPLLSDADLLRLRDLVKASIARGTVTLASGKTSDFYVDGRLVTLSPEGSVLIGKACLALAKERQATAIVGPVTGACPMVTAAGVLAAQEGTALKLAYVRAEPKGHGLQKAIEGPALTKDDRVLVVDDVMTSGGSVLKAIERLEAETGCKVLAAMTVVDREAGGREALEKAGVELVSVLTKRQLTAAS
jgi:orotate phosphoribosyltransferase